MIGCLRTRVRKQPIIALYFESELVLKFYNLEASCYPVKAAYSVTMNIFRKKYFLFKSFVNVELSYVFTIKMFSTAENCMEK